MNWIHEVTEVVTNKNPIYRDFSIRELTIPNESRETILTHFYVSLCRNGGVVIIPIPNENILDQVKKEVVPFFNKARLEYSNGKVLKIHLESPSITSFKDQHKAIDEFFLSDERVEFPIKQKKIYKIKKEFFKFKKDSDLNHLLTFFRSVYVEEDLIFSPYGWELSENLKFLQILNVLVCEADNVYLWVDNANEKIALLQVNFN